MKSRPSAVILEPWGGGDLPLLDRLMGDPRMTEHLGGPESPDKLRERQGRYEHPEGGDRMFKIVELASGAGVGSALQAAAKKRRRSNEGPCSFMGASGRRATARPP